jgi:hypothetical protein
MVFADIEYSGVADELAAKARAGEFDFNYETEPPKTARLISESGEHSQEEPDDMELESEAHFEISLDKSGPTELQETKAEPEPSIPEAETEDFQVLAADSIDSATMDEHIQATITEDATEQEELPAEDAEADLVEATVASDDEPKIIVAVPDAPSSPELANVEHEPVADPAPQTVSDHPAQADSEDDTSAAAPQGSDLEDAQVAAS